MIQLFRKAGTSKKGFSLVELLVSISIILVLTMIGLVNYASVSGRQKVNAAANTIYNAMKKARHDSVAIKVFKDVHHPSYGMYVDTSTADTQKKVILYADCEADDNNDQWVDENDTFKYTPSSPTCSGAGGDLVQEFYFEKGVITEIRSIIPGQAPVIQSRVDMLFMRPEPTIWITLADDTLLPVGSVEIDIEDTRHNARATVVFWSTGQFDIK